MSRTYKDKPSKLKHEPYNQDYILVEHYGFHKYRLGKTTKVKKPRRVDTEWHWMSTPSWWTKMTMIKPERRHAHLIEKYALKAEDLESIDFPDLGRKPHIYYW